MAKKSKEETIQKIKDWVKKNANRLFLSGMGLLLAGRLFIWWTESNYVIPPGELAAPNEIQQLTDTLDVSKVEFTQVVKMITPYPDFTIACGPAQPLATTTTYSALTQINMFDPKSISGADALIARAEPLVQQGRAALAAKDVTGARNYLRQAMDINPAQLTGIKLREDIDAYVKAQATATSATATQ